MKLIILGASRFGRTIADIATQRLNYSGPFFLNDSNYASNVIGRCGEFTVGAMVKVGNQIRACMKIEAGEVI